MPRPIAEARKRALARIQRLCCLGVDSKTLMPDLMREVKGLLPAQDGTFYWLRGTDLKYADGFSTVPASIQNFWRRNFLRTPLEHEVFRPPGELLAAPVRNQVEQFGQCVHVDDRKFIRSEYYNYLWRPIGLRDCLMLRVREADRNHGVLYVYRAAGQGLFGPDDIKTLELIAGFVTHAMTPAALSDGGFVDSDDRALLVADRDGTVRYAGRQAEVLLRMLLSPDEVRPRNCRVYHEPIPELARVCQALTATAKGEVGQLPPVLRLRNPWGEFILRAYWLGPTDGAEQIPQIGITIKRRVPRPLAVLRRVEDLPLTEREKQLCLLLARGLSGQDLANAMGVAVSTAVTHQRNVYAKLGVHSRTALFEALQPS